MMEGFKKIKHPGSYIIWFVSSVWRRRISVLAVVILTILLIVCLEYNVTKEIVQNTLSRQESNAGAGLGAEIQAEAAGSIDNDAIQKNRLRTVQFIDDEGFATRDTVVDVMGRSGSARMLDDSSISRRNVNSDYNKRNLKIPYIPNHRIVHLDLKGAPPKIAFIRKLFVLVKELGATGILLEWEDMFPWGNNLKNLAAKNAFSRMEAKEIIVVAQKLNLEVIPLIQTFGHLEFALKNKEFVHLREIPESPQALCPSLNASLEFIKDMINQVMQLHKNVNYLHIGCDEVFTLGRCSRCRKKLRDELFLSHVTQVAKYIRKRYPYVTPIIWDDMLRVLPFSTLDQFKIGKLVEPMVWVYAENVYRFVPQTVWEKYQNVFSNAWIASAFKGAFGETYYIPNVKRHLDNNLKWLELMSIEENRFKNGFRGIAITGWQRYDHFATLCEMLPASVPSLAVNLAVVSHGYANNSLREFLHKTLNCGITSSMGAYIHEPNAKDSFLNLDSDPFLWDQFSRCMFIGSQFYRTLSRWHTLEKEVNEYLVKIKSKRAWLTDYNVRRNYTSPLRVDELMEDESRIYYNLLSMIQSVNDALDGIYDKYTIAEWIEQTIYPTILKLEELQKVSKKLRNMHTWPRRPLPRLNDLQRLGVFAFSSDGSNINTTALRSV